MIQQAEDVFSGTWLLSSDEGGGGERPHLLTGWEGKGELFYY